MSAYQTLRLTRDGAVLTIEMAHPGNGQNAMDGVMHAELSRVFGDIRDDEARVVILTGNGATFGVGADPHWLFGCGEGDAAAAGLKDEARRIILDLLALRAPIIAAVDGPAAGLTATLALFCDFMVMDEAASLSDGHVRGGLAAGDGGTIIWPEALGMARAKRHLMLGAALTASNALACGLAHAVTPVGHSMTEARLLAARLARMSPGALHSTKALLNERLRREVALDLEPALDAELATLTDPAFRTVLKAAL